MKPVLRRPAARSDVDGAIDYYIDIDRALAFRFVDELEHAIGHIQRHPGMGFPRYATMLNVVGLRHWLLRRFPYTVFYIETEGAIEVLRVLHQSADIPVQLRD
jgi:toxin ParE1/3/4